LAPGFDREEKRLGDAIAYAILFPKAEFEKYKVSGFETADSSACAFACSGMYKA